MKNPLRGMSRKKTSLLAAVPLAFIIASGVFVLLPPQHPTVDFKSSISHEKPRPADGYPLNSRPSVLTPILLLDEAFKGYKIPKILPPERREGDEQNTTPDSGAAADTAGHVQTALKPEEKEGAEPVKLKLTRGEARAGGEAQETTAHVKSAVDELSEDINLINEMASKAEMSETERRKIVQSYKDLCEVLPKSEARKIIKVRIGMASE